MSQINFLPPEFQTDLLQRRRRPKQVASVAVTVLSLAGVWFLSQNTGALATESEQLSAQLSREQDKSATAAQLRGQLEQIMSQREIAREICPPVGTREVLAVISQLTPTSIKINELTLDNNHPAPPPLMQDDKPRRSDNASSNTTPTQYEIDLRGFAPDQADIVEMIRLLSEHPLFTDVRHRTSQAVTYDQYIAHKFHVVATIDLNRQFVRQQVQGASHAP